MYFSYSFIDLCNTKKLVDLRYLGVSRNWKTTNDPKKTTKYEFYDSSQGGNSYMVLSEFLLIDTLNNPMVQPIMLETMSSHHA